MAPRKKSKPAAPAIVTTADRVPRRCPRNWDSTPVRTSESGGVVRLTCWACGWSERYLVVDRI